MELLHDASNCPPSLSEFFKALPDSPKCLFTERQHVSTSEVQSAAVTLSAEISKRQATPQVFAKGKNNSDGRGAEGRLRSNHRRDEEYDGADNLGGAQAHTPPHVVLFLDRGVAYVVAVVAALKAGAAFVPLDPSWPAAKIWAVLMDCSPELILTTPALLPNLQWAVSAIQTFQDTSSGSTAWKDHFQANCTTFEVSCAGEPLLIITCNLFKKHDTPTSAPASVEQRVQVSDFHHFSAPDHRSSPDKIEDQLAPFPPAFTHPPSYCYILYTSGSTGQPKGVCGTQQGLLNRLRWMAVAYPYQRDEVSCFKTGVGFVDHLTELLSPLLAGVPIFIPPAKTLLENPWALLEYIEEHHITRLVAVPSLLRMLLSPWEASAGAGRLSSLRLLVSSGEAIPWELARRLQGALPGTTILNLYGSTEVTGDVLAFDVSKHLAAGGATSSPLVPIGRPILHHQVLLLNGSQEAVQDDQVGELCVAGPGLFSGYLRNPEATRAAFFLRERAGGADIPHAPADTLEVDRFYRTGDLAQRLPDGNLVWVGRKDRQVKVRGHRVQLEEVEAALRSCPLVRAVAVKAWPLRGQELTLAAYVVWRQQKPRESGAAGVESDGKQGGASEYENTGAQTELSAMSVPEHPEPFDGEAQTAVRQGGREGGRPGPAQTGQHVALEQLGEHLRTRLLAAAMPSWIEVVSEIGLTSSGKVDYASLPPPSWDRPLRTEADIGHLKTDARDGEVRQGLGGLFSGSERSPFFRSSGIRIDARAKQPASDPPPDPSAQSEDVQAGVLRAFQQVLGLAHVGGTDDFFSAGGSSVTAAELAHLLGVDMRWVYSHCTPQKLAEALRNRNECVQVPLTDQSNPFKAVLATINAQVQKPDSEKNRDSLVSTQVELNSLTGRAGLPEKDFLDRGSTEDRSLTDRATAASDVIFWDSDDENASMAGVSPDEGVLTRSERDPQVLPGQAAVAGSGQWQSRDPVGLPVLDESLPVSLLSPISPLWERLVQAWGPFSLTRGNRRELLSCSSSSSQTPGQDKVENREALRGREGSARLPLLRDFTLSPELSPQPFFLQAAWRTRLGLCVDASPLLLVARGVAPRVLIGSHAHNFKCLDASTGATIWECEVGGRIEATAAVTQDGDKVLVGCYDGKIYVLDARQGSVRWSFQTGGEVKCQAVVDPWGGFLWCGSHDHHLYVLDTSTETCVYSHDCGGSIYGAAAFDVNLGRAYVVTTKGDVVAFDGRSCQELWTLDMTSPLFASPAVTPSGLLLCASVDGYVTAVSPSGDVSWRTRMGGPVFAGPCLSPALPGQAVICSRNGHVQGLDTHTGRQLWGLEPDVKWVGEPITASAAVDETVIIHTDSSHCPGDLTILGGVYRLVWICGSEGTIRALAVRAHVSDREEVEMKQEKASQIDSEWKDGEMNEGRSRGCGYRLSKRRHTESSAGSRLQSEGSPEAKVLAVGKLPGEVFSSPVASGGSIYVGCRDDYVYRVDLLSAAVYNDGRLLPVSSN